MYSSISTVKQMNVPCCVLLSWWWGGRTAPMTGGGGYCTRPTAVSVASHQACNLMLTDIFAMLLRRNRFA